jgi:hypothetical protein
MVKTKTPKTAEPHAEPHQIDIMTLKNQIDGLQQMIGTAMTQLQGLEHRINDNYTKFVFHDHRRVDTAGPQFYNTEYETAWLQERQRAAQEPPKPEPPTEKPSKRDKK